jgi:GTPase SAR1 family protein
MGQQQQKPNNQINLETSTKKKQFKLLLLGTLESGKSTIFKQLKKNLQNEPYTEEETIQFRNYIYLNLLTSTKFISMDFISKNPDDPLDDPENINRVKQLVENDDFNYLTKMEELYTFEIHQNIGEIWKENAVTENFKTRSEYFHGIDNLQYFLDRFEKLTPSKYIPTYEDILRCSKKTNGRIQSLNFDCENLEFEICDVGGMRFHRRLWASRNN